MRPLKFKFPALIVFVAVSLSLVSCSAEKKLKRRITGTWTITSYQEQNVNGEDGSIADPGIMEFFRNGRGKKTIKSIPWRRSLAEGTDFRWQNSSNTVTIFDQNSIFAKSWIITVNKRSRQQWRSTDRGNVQTIELKKQ